MFITRRKFDMEREAKLILGIGLKGEKYPSHKDGKILREYNTWTGMIRRCTKECWSKNPSYVGTTCSDNFKSYTFFYEWCQTQVGFNSKDEKGKSWNLDKDLLVRGNKIYSETTCVFVPQNVNCLLTKSEAKRGKYLIGVCWDKQHSKFRAFCKDGKRKNINLGRHSTEQEAFLAYKLCKEDVIKKVAEEYKYQLDYRVYESLMKYEVSEND